MSLTIKKTALAAAIGLSISTSPVSAFPLWGFTGFGDSSGGFGGIGALGGDNQYAPFDGRYSVLSGGMEFTAYESESLNGDYPYSFISEEFQVGPPTHQVGDLTVRMKLEGRAYNFPDLFDGRDKVEIIDPDVNVSGDEYIELGGFTYEMTYRNVLFGHDGEDAVPYSVLVAPSYNGPYHDKAHGEGTLTYDTDIVNEIVDGEVVDISIDGEMQGDVVKIATPDCAVLDVLRGSSESRSRAVCGDSFFQMIIPADGSPAKAFSPVGETGERRGIPDVFDFNLGESFDDPLGPLIPTDVISLFHAGLPCTEGDHASPSAEAFYCDPIPGNFPTFVENGGPNASGIPVFGDPQNRVYRDYGEYVGGFNPGGKTFGTSGTATAVPTPATGLLFGVGLAGLGFARRRAKSQSDK